MKIKPKGQWFWLATRRAKQLLDLCRILALTCWICSYRWIVFQLLFLAGGRGFHRMNGVESWLSYNNNRLFNTLINRLANSNVEWNLNQLPTVMIAQYESPLIYRFYKNKILSLLVPLAGFSLACNMVNTIIYLTTPNVILHSFQLI